MHNALQGGEINLTERKKRIYEEVVYENVIRNHLDHERVIIHDPQPLSMVRHYEKKRALDLALPPGPDQAQQGALGISRSLRRAL